MEGNNYSLREYMDDLYEVIFAGTLDGSPVDPCRRELQRAYLKNLKGVMRRDFVDNPDVTSLIFGQLERIKVDAQKAVGRSKSYLTKTYWEDLSEFQF